MGKTPHKSQLLGTGVIETVNLLSWHTYLGPGLGSCNQILTLILFICVEALTHKLKHQQWYSQWINQNPKQNSNKTLTWAMPQGDSEIKHNTQSITKGKKRVFNCSIFKVMRGVLN
jgi:hypothetical protein